jgi:hypothetical protein
MVPAAAAPRDAMPRPRRHPAIIEVPPPVTIEVPGPVDEG